MHRSRITLNPFLALFLIALIGSGAAMFIIYTANKADATAVNYNSDSGVNAQLQNLNYGELQHHHPKK